MSRFLPEAAAIRYQKRWNTGPSEHGLLGAQIVE